MKTVSQFKKFVRPGQIWHAYNHLMSTDMGNRPVVQVLSNSVSFATSRGQSWLPFPKAKDFVSTGPQSFDILEGGVKVLSYRLIEAESLIKDKSDE